MIKTILTMAFAGATGVGGYFAGSIFPAPEEWTDAINAQASDLRAKLKLEKVDFAGFRSLVSESKFGQIKKELNDMAIAAGEVIEVDDSGTMEEQFANLALDPSSVSGSQAPAPASGLATPTPAAAVTPPPVATAGFEATLSVCPRMTVQNGPLADAQLRVAKYSPVVDVKGIRIATFPSRGACLSSGFGPRNSRLHKGIDYHSETGAPILAAGDGQVVEMKYRDDYGNMIVIEHGGGVYTRYAHLASFGKGLTAGVSVKAGEQIGLMGNSAGYQIPMHLHYELLMGDYNTPKASFGLEPVDPLTFPAVR